MSEELYIPATPIKDRRMLGIGLSLGAALCLVFAAISRMWLVRPMLNDLGFGPLGCHNCNIQGDGGSMSNSAFVEMIRTMAPDQASSAFAPMGYVTFAVCILAALGLVGSALIAFQNKRPELKISPPTVALLAIMIGLISGCVFIATKPGGPGFVGVAIGFWAFGIGCVLGIAGAQMLAKVIRPVDPDLLAGAMNPEQY